MTKEDLNKKIEILEERIFYLQMKDRWNFRDLELIREWNKELNNLKKMLKNA